MECRSVGISGSGPIAASFYRRTESCVLEIAGAGDGGAGVAQGKCGGWATKVTSGVQSRGALGGWGRGIIRLLAASALAALKTPKSEFKSS